MPNGASTTRFLPAGPLLAWKRGDARLVVRRLWLALLVAAILGLVAYAVVTPRKAPMACLATVIDRYIATSKKALGRTKEQVLRTIKTRDIADASAGTGTNESS